MEQSKGKRTELRLCKRCFTMKNIRVNKLICRRCEIEHDKGTRMRKEKTNFTRVRVDDELVILNPESSQDFGFLSSWRGCR